MESLWGSTQIELLNRQRWLSIVELSSAMADDIENFYNFIRRYSSLSYFTSEEFENLQLSET
jgi:transposase InsO family protein